MQREEYLPVSNSHDPHGWTNQILVHENDNKTQLFLPAYLRSKLKNIVSLDSSTGMGQMNCVVIFSVYYGTLNDIFPGILKTIENNIALRFKIDPPMNLEDGFVQFTDKDGTQRSTYITKKIDQNEKLITFSIRKMFAVHLISHVFWSPFEYIEYVNTISIDSINFQYSKQKININFNLMDLDPKFDRFSVVSYTDEGALGEYDLATSMIDAQFSNHRFYSGDLHTQIKNRFKSKLHLKKSLSNEDGSVHDEKFKGKIQAFNFGHAIYPVYRRPLVPLFNLLFPVALLGFINLGIFFQDNLFVSKKIINIASLLIAYLQFLQTVRQTIPNSRSLTIAEMSLFGMASLTLLTYFHSISVRSLKQYEFVWNNEILYEITLLMTLVIVSFLSTIALVFAFCLLPTYNSRRVRKQEKFDRKNWGNRKCDEYFSKVQQSNGGMIELSKYGGNGGKRRN